MSTINNIPLNRFNTASALQQTATHYEVNGRADIHKVLVQLLRRDAQELIELGLSELRIRHEANEHA